MSQRRPAHAVLVRRSGACGPSTGEEPCVCGCERLSDARDQKRIARIYFQRRMDDRVCRSVPTCGRRSDEFPDTRERSIQLSGVAGCGTPSVDVRAPCGRSWHGTWPMRGDRRLSRSMGPRGQTPAGAPRQVGRTPAPTGGIKARRVPHPVADAECRPNGRLGRVDWSERRPRGEMRVTAGIVFPSSRGRLCASPTRAAMLAQNAPTYAAKSMAFPWFPDALPSTACLVSLARPNVPRHSHLAFYGACALN